MKKTFNMRGFTLIELMVVSAIIALLATIILSSLSNSKAKSRDAERIQEIKQVQTALELYRLEFGYPQPPDEALAQGNEFSSTLNGLVEQNFLPEIPTPPNGSVYQNEVYSYQTQNTEGRTLSCQGKSLSTREIPYILYFYTEIPQNLPQLINNGSPVTNTYCLTV